MQAVLLAQHAKYFGGHAGVSMMRPIENLCLDQRLREHLGKPFPRRINVFAKIRMMNETFATDFQLRCQLTQVFFDNLPIGMHKGIETENEIH